MHDNVLVTISSGLPPLAEQCVIMNRLQLAVLHGFTYCHFDHTLDPTRAGSWQKVLVLQAVMAFARVVMTMDHDAFFARADVNPFGVLNSSALLNEHFDVLFSSDFDRGRHEGLHDTSSVSINAGVFFAKTSAWTRAFISRLYKDFPEAVNHNWWEQQAILLFRKAHASEFREHVRVIGWQHFNSLKKDYRPGDLVSHIAGGGKNGKNELIISDCQLFTPAMHNHSLTLYRPANLYTTNYTAKNLTRVFEDIYARSVWGRGQDGGLGSGHGSSLAATSKMRPQLIDLLLKLNISHLIDAGAGAMAWMPLVLDELAIRRPAGRPALHYTGLDVACSVIDLNKARFNGRSNMEFVCADMSAGLPKLGGAGGDAVVLTRNAWQHLPLATVLKAIGAVKASGVRWLVAGSYINSPSNTDVHPGAYFSINLLKPPFSLVPPPITIIDEQFEGKHLLVFDVAELKFGAPETSMM